MKACNACGVVRPLEAFYPRKHVKDGRRGICRLCMRPKERAFRERYRKNRPDVARRAIYGLTPEQYHAILTGQGGGCAICGGIDRLCVDHCHKSDKIRGVLCNRCNLVIGYAEDNHTRMEAAIAYLKKHSGG